VPQWLKNLTLILVLLAWSASVIVKIRSGDLPDPTYLGVPVVAFVALTTSIRLPHRKPAAPTVPRPAPVVAAHDDEQESER
jgi:hypothetical protein